MASFHVILFLVVVVNNIYAAKLSRCVVSINNGVIFNNCTQNKWQPIISFGSSNLGSTDLGSSNLGSTDLGSTDLGSTDLGSTDLGSTDLGSTDLGSTDLNLSNDLTMEATTNYPCVVSINNGVIFNNCTDKPVITYGSSCTIVEDNEVIDICARKHQPSTNYIYN